MTFNKTKIHKSYNLFINIIILIGAYLFLYYQIFHNKELEDFLSIFRYQLQQPTSIIVFSIVALLMPLQWSIESVKWQYLIRKVERISFINSFRSVLTGITTSIFTPNRIGDFIGRVFILKKANPWKSTFISIIGSISQFLITFAMGSLGLMLFLIYFSEMHYTELGILFYALFGTLLFLSLVFILFYFKVSIMTGFLQKIIPVRFKMIRIYIRVFASFSSKELLLVLMFSLFRYLLFNFQLYLLFRIFSIEINLFESLVISSCIFFILSFIPSFALAEIGIRGSVVIAIFSIIDKGYNLGAVAAITILWIINIVIPALAGSVFIFKLRFFRRISVTKKSDSIQPS